MKSYEMWFIMMIHIIFFEFWEECKMRISLHNYSSIDNCIYLLSWLNNELFEKNSAMIFWKRSSLYSQTELVLGVCISLSVQAYWRSFSKYIYAHKHISFDGTIETVWHDVRIKVCHLFPAYITVQAAPPSRIVIDGAAKHVLFAGLQATAQRRQLDCSQDPMCRSARCAILVRGGRRPDTLAIVCPTLHLPQSVEKKLDVGL